MDLKALASPKGSTQLFELCGTKAKLSILELFGPTKMPLMLLWRVDAFGPDQNMIWCEANGILGPS